MFHMNRMEFLSSSGGSSNLRVNTANWSKGTTFYFTANIPELNFILPCMTRLHIPQDQREDVFILQDFTRCSWYYFFPIFKPVNSGERISSNGTGYQDILPRSCCHWSRFANEPGLNTILRFCSLQTQFTNQKKMPSLNITTKLTNFRESNHRQGKLFWTCRLYIFNLKISQAFILEVTFVHTKINHLFGTLLTQSRLILRAKQRDFKAALKGILEICP